jgi:RNA polymerase sigma-70 factor (ECF subfamily)
MTSPSPDGPGPRPPRSPTLTDPAAYAAVYDAHAGDVFRVALSIVGDRQVAEDVTHDVFLELWRHPHRFDPARGELGSFLKLMARSRGLDAWRRTATVHRTRERVEHEVGSGPAHHEDASVAAERSTGVPALRNAVRRLPAAQRHTITLAYWGGLSAAEIAQHSGTPLGTVKGRLRLGLARLARDVDVASGAALVR